MLSGPHQPQPHRGTWGLTKLPRGPQSHRPLCSVQPAESHTEALDISPDANRCSILQERKLRPRAAVLFARGPTEMRARRDTSTHTYFVTQAPPSTPPPGGDVAWWGSLCTQQRYPAPQACPGAQALIQLHVSSRGLRPNHPQNQTLPGLISAGSVKGRRPQKGRW